MAWKADLQPTIEAQPRLWMEWLVRQFRGLNLWSIALDNTLAGFTGLVSYGASITDDAGDGTVHGDLNATDFTGHPYADPTVTTALMILPNGVVSFGHKAIAYKWTGPSGITVGVGGSHTAVATDLVPIGTADHNLLINRSSADQHPTSAITNLDNDQATQDANIAANTSNLTQHINNTSNPHQVNHSQLPDVDPDPDDPHQQYQKKLPGMVLYGSTDSFTLNTTDSKLVNWENAAQWNWTDQNDVNPSAGEITIPIDGIYSLVAGIIGNQGNDNKEEWIEMKLDIVGGPTAGRTTISEREVPTDKTSLRSLNAVATRFFHQGQVCSLYMWGSTGLGTFTVDRATFELIKIAEAGDVVP